MDPRPSIIVVDDESGIRELLVEWLGEDGYAVHSAADPVAALALLDDNPEIVLLLTDIVMPGGLNGFDLARRARALRPALKIIFISAYSMAETVLAARSKAEPILRKPFRHEQFMTQVRRVLDAPAAC
jgi:CheY-like chemotaxis protein